MASYSLVYHAILIRGWPALNTAVVMNCHMGIWLIGLSLKEMFWHTVLPFALPLWWSVGDSGLWKTLGGPSTSAYLSSKVFYTTRS